MGNREELTLLFSDCYSIDGSVCKLHPVFQPQKAINKLFELGYRKPGELLSQEKLRQLNEQWEDEYEDVVMTDAEWEEKRWGLIAQAQYDQRGE